ncbi:hypothetical protein D3C81_1597180 [compost metagenome]|uniref:hypothetical protein n=1 Tax=Serratia marcescens TaxID=615 RepID=UPI000AD1C4F5|nr:hypothetical protein [Serratia marcescens]
MSRAPQGRAYALSAEQHRYLTQKAVALTRTLEQPISCRYVLDALLSLSLNFDDKVLAQQLRQRFSEPPRSRKTRRRE